MNFLKLIKPNDDGIKFYFLLFFFINMNSNLFWEQDENSQTLLWPIMFSS